MAVSLRSDLKVADEVWIATALLHRDRQDSLDFSIEEIVERVQREDLHGSLRPGVYVHVVQSLRQRMLERGDQLLTSTFTLGELLVKPVKNGTTELCQRYERALSSSAVLIPFDAKAAIRYAHLRFDRAIRPSDAIQLACASAAHVDLFITNDERLHSKRVDGIQFLVSLHKVPS